MRVRPPEWCGHGASRWWREPLVHFLAIGAVLFAVFDWRGGAGDARIVITPGQIDALAAVFERTWQRPPTEEELKGQIDEYVREEIATREAMTLGLDRDDTVVRRRLRQKLEFLAEDTTDATLPTDADLRAWLETHADRYRSDPEVAFRQVYLSPERRPTIDEDARRLVAELERRGPDAPLDTLGDRLMLPHEVERASQTDIARQFGEDFAETLVTLQPGRWQGPLRSEYGVHVVLLRERIDGGLPGFAAIRAVVARDFMTDRRRRQLDAMYDNLLGRYRVIMERRAEAATPVVEGPNARRGQP
jgi:PPIC-type PPIASE domain